MDDAKKVGATGEFPDGKLNEHDEGGLNIQIAHDEKGTVIVNFGKQVAWLAMPAADAANLGLTLLSHAGAKFNVNYPEEFFEQIVDAVMDCTSSHRWKENRDAAIRRVKAMMSRSPVPPEKHAET